MCAQFISVNICHDYPNVFDTDYIQDSSTVSLSLFPLTTLLVAN